MEKKHLYFVPGLGANTKIFEYLNLSKEKFELHFLEWLLPISIDESIEAYARRMCENIHHENPILIGVSFGGIMVQEMSKIISCEKVILISSIKNNKELPKRLKLAYITGVYKLFPSKIIANIEHYERYFFNDYLKKRAELYKIYLSKRDENYLQWSVYNVLHWQQSETLSNTTHIHGTDDEVFPAKNLQNYIKIEKGTHIMILNKAKTISEILEKECFK
ncbi:alpha/beta hydrolase [Tenacibaculum dicentrarchi]|uniref:alpha/beta hydrolase n=1 Tax=Tenacibaculum dicentrarchi TaxID=669041 RepID=UPI0035171BEA